MIISRAYAARLIRAGKAAHIGQTTDNGTRYMIIERYDAQRTDHVVLRGLARPFGEIGKR